MWSASMYSFQSDSSHTRWLCKTPEITCTSIDMLPACTATHCSWHCLCSQLMASVSFHTRIDRDSPTWDAGSLVRAVFNKHILHSLTWFAYFADSQRGVGYNIYQSIPASIQLTLNGLLFIGSVIEYWRMKMSVKHSRTDTPPDYAGWLRLAFNSLLEPNIKCSLFQGSSWI